MFPQAGRRELDGATAPCIGLRSACGESSRLCPLRVLMTERALCPGLRGLSGASAPS